MGARGLRVAAATAVLAALAMGGTGACPADPDCVCGGKFAYELNCNINGHKVKVNYLPKTYLSIECDKTYKIDYDRLPQLNANKSGIFKSVSFKQCPLPKTSFRDVLSKVGVSKTMTLIYQNSKNISNSLERKLFTGLQDLSKLSLSINGLTYLPDDLFVDVYNLTWLNIRSNSIGFSEKLFKPLDKLETLEISHNHMTNMSGNIFSHLAYLRKLSLWQSNVTNFSQDLFAGVNVLEELDLSSNGLNELPSSLLSPLRKLKKLTLFSNKFSSLPSNLLLNNQELDTIIIFNNDVKLMQLPRAFLGNLPKLQQSYIQRCGLEAIPYDVFVNSSQLTNISLAYNELKALPEAVFNDQINLLDLDLSNNKIRSLPYKLFSSLVRLERLKLEYNELEEISSATFSSLLSLTYLNMERNKLKTISSYVFSNNKQRLSINMAFNKLNFEAKESNNSSHKQKSHLSPFAYTYQLKLLNLSYNFIDKTFSDWWSNGCENLDLSYNKIRQLTIMDYEDILCPNAMKITCDTALSSVIAIGVVLSVVFFVISTVAVINFLLKHKSKLYYLIKNWCYKYTEDTDDESHRWDLIVIFAEKDKEFVHKCLIKKLETYKFWKVKTFVIDSNIINAATIKSCDVEFDKCIGSVKGTKTLIVVTLNYLELVRNNSNIEELHGKYVKNDETIFILTSEVSSINTISKGYVDTNRSLKWDETDFWKKFLHVLPDRKFKDPAAVKVDLAERIESTLLHSTAMRQIGTENLEKLAEHNGPTQDMT
ncbi:Protein toll [Eumeta japonica]|uniref:Protein toll n=1 Tax=Eumeta variegata TaxID=151549 RepID=A0A4C1T3Y0_EUMVA|nr:Protein toll [Eumeta japonica]